MTRLQVSVRKFWCKLWWWWYMEGKLIRMEENVLSLHQSFLLSIIAIAKPLCFPFGWKFCIDPLVDESKLSMRVEEKCTCNYWNCQYGRISEKNQNLSQSLVCFLVNYWQEKNRNLSQSLVCFLVNYLPNESVRSLMHAAIVVNS